MTLLIRGSPAYYHESYQIDAVSKAEAIWRVTNWIQKHSDMDWKDFEFVSCTESGGRKRK